jgi:hypothetical protein
MITSKDYAEYRSTKRSLTANQWAEIIKLLALILGVCALKLLIFGDA